MSKSRAVAVGLAAVALLIGTRRYLASSTTPTPQDTSPIVLSAASGATIEFRTQNGQTMGDVLPEIKQIPHLVLVRNGALTDARERTLTVALNRIVVPAGGITLTLTVETQHTDPDGGDGASRIVVWQESRRLQSATSEMRIEPRVQFEQVFEHERRTGEVAIPTPTDYFRYRVTATTGSSDERQTLFAEEHAFLLEAQATAALTAIQEATPGAAPDALIVTFCDMVPFRHTTPDGTQQLQRAEVTAYVQEQLIPGLVEAIRVETDEWGFPWHEEWTSYRPEDGERLGVALVDGETWFHGSSPQDAHAGIALNVSRDLYGTQYKSLTDQLISCFYHELFHNLQRDLVLHYGGHGDVAGIEGVWHFFHEGTAAAAASIGAPLAELSTETGAGHYLLNANRFLGDASSPGYLNTPIQETNLYASALYWRFLYEQCGGMDVIREALTALYTGEVADIRSSEDIVGALPSVLDRALVAAACPFETHTASLEAFTRSLYALHLQEGRSISPERTDNCRLYDPADLYRHPAAERIIYSGMPVTYETALQAEPAGIPNSFGVDFVEVDLAQTVDGQPLTIELSGQPGAAATFSVQVWSLTVDGAEASAAQEVVMLSPDAEGHLTYTLANIDWRTTQQLAILITRVDAEQDSDPIGAYTMTLNGLNR